MVGEELEKSIAELENLLASSKALAVAPVAIPEEREIGGLCD